MEIEALSVSINQQILTANKLHSIVDDTANIYTASFNFDDEWEGFAKSVIMQNGQEFAFALLDHDNRCQIPARVIRSGALYIGVQGYKDGKVLTTKEADGIKISNSGGTISLVPEPFEPSEYQKLMDRLAEVQEFVGDMTALMEQMQQDVSNRANEVAANTQIVYDAAREVADAENVVLQSEENVKRLAAETAENTEEAERMAASAWESEKEAAKSKDAAELAEKNAAEKAAEAKNSEAAARKSAAESLQSATETKELKENVELMYENVTLLEQDVEQKALEVAEHTLTAEQASLSSEKSKEEAGNHAANALAAYEETEKQAKAVEQSKTEAERQAGIATEKATEAERQAGIATEKATELSDAVEQVSQNKNAITALQSGKADAIVQTVTGNVIAVDDASNLPLQSLTIYGKSTQDGTPTPEAPVEIVSVDSPKVYVHGANLIDIKKNELYNAIIEDDMTIRSNLINSNFCGITIKNTGFLKNGCTYKFSIDGLPSDRDIRIIVFGVRTDGNNFIGAKSITGIGEVYITVRGFIKISRVELKFNVANRNVTDTETVFSNAYFGVVDTDYKPYIEQQSSLFPYTLRGVPVNTGGNYTDADGQKWVCDTVEVNSDGNGKLVQRCYVIFVNKMDSVYDSTVGGSNKAKGFFVRSLIKDASYLRAFISDRYTFKSIGGYEIGTLWIGVNNKHIYIPYSEFYDSELEDKGLANFNAFLLENPIEIVTYYDTPIITDLTPEEVQAFLAMHSNKPYTTIYNDAGADQTVEYVADTKIYIDKKFDELQNAILSQGGNV